MFLQSTFFVRRICIRFEYPWTANANRKCRSFASIKYIEAQDDRGGEVVARGTHRACLPLPATEGAI